MNDFITFLLEHWFQLVTGLAFVLEILFIFIKRKPKSLDDFKLALSDILSKVPELIISRERPGEGDLKKSEVEVACLKYIERRLGRGLTVQECVLVKNEVDSKIETVLSTPTKKEILNEK